MSSTSNDIYGYVNGKPVFLGMSLFLQREDLELLKMITNC